MPIVTIWMWNCTIILQGDTTGDKWLKGTQDLSVIFLQLHVSLWLYQNKKFNFYKMTKENISTRT